MALAHGTKIVRDGLVLHLDAANPRSYSGTGTDWFDLSGNDNHGTLVNGPTFVNSNAGYFSFDGADDYVSFSTYQQPESLTTSSFTWSIWVYTTRINFNVIMGNRYPGVNFIKITSSRMEYYPTSFGGQLSVNIWQNVAFVKDQTNLLYYINGNLTASAVSTREKEPRPFYIGGDATGERSSSDISTASVYNRALTQTEIQQNFNAMKGRYGL